MSTPLTGSALISIIDISADAIICVDREQRVLFFNEGAEAIFGYARDEVLGQRLDMLLPEQLRALHARHVDAFGQSPVRARRMGERQEIEGRRKNGEQFPAEAAIAKLEPGEGDAVMYSVVLRDVTERRRAERELQRAVTARDETLSVVAHDLRNPVSAVKMLAGALLRGVGEHALPPEMAAQASVIQSAARQMDALIQDLLDMSRVEAGRFVVDTYPTPAAALLDAALRTLAPLAEAKNIRLETAWNGSLPEVNVDPDRVAQVLSNVIGNAIKFTPAGGVVSIVVVARDEHLLVSVTDNGPGVPAEHAEHVFDRYWQVSRRNRGAGLGLPIARAIVEAHGGRIWVEAAPSGGALFQFTLPTAR